MTTREKIRQVELLNSNTIEVNTHISSNGKKNSIDK